MSRLNDSLQSQDPTPPGPTGVGLPELLNILVRGRRTILVLTLVGVLAGIAYGILTKPLYRATAQVRPGIVAYSDQGGPVREWALKDIVRWFRAGLFWDDLRTRDPFDRYKGPPIILAEFITSGPQYLRGGDVVTLTTLSRQPEVAREILDRSIEIFNAQGSSDSANSTLQLTLRGTKVRMDIIRSQMDKIDGEIQRADLGAQEIQTQIAMVEARIQKIESQLAHLRFGREWRREAIDTTRAEVEAARQRLAEAQAMLTRLAAESGGASRRSTGASDPVDALLLETVRRNEAALAGELVARVNDLGAYVYHSTLRADSLRDHVYEIEAQMEALRLEREITLAEEKKKLALKAEDFIIQRDIEFPSEKKVLAADLRAEEIRAEILSPLERVGPTSVSQKPVRPRRLRATAILTVLAFLGSIFLVFLREYLHRNREAILADQRD